MNPQPFPGDAPGNAPEPAPGGAPSDAPTDTRRAIAESVPYATYGLIAINLLIFVVSAGRGGVGNTDPEVLYNMGMLWAPDVWAGQWWRLFTAMFLHAGLMHIGFNGFVLYQIGPELERIYGAPRFVLVYLGAGWIGSLASLIWGGASVGASGAIFGLAGAFLAISLRRRAYFQAFGSQMLFFVAINLAIGFSGAFGLNIDNYGHLGGLVGGFILGNIVANRLPEFAPTPTRWALTAAVLLAFVAATPLAVRASEKVLAQRFDPR